MKMTKTYRYGSIVAFVLMLMLALVQVGGDATAIVVVIVSALIFLAASTEGKSPRKSAKEEHTV